MNQTAILRMVTVLLCMATMVGCQSWVTCKDNDTWYESDEIFKDVTGRDIEQLESIENTTCEDLCSTLGEHIRFIDSWVTTVDFDSIAGETLEPDTVYGTIECSGKYMEYPPCK